MRTLIRYYFAATIFLFLTFPLSSGAATPREHVIYPFAGIPDCGNLPTAPLIADRKGNLYGTTLDGGANHDGCVFKLSPEPDGKWTETVLHSFTEVDGGGPSAALRFDESGNLYGTTEGGGIYGRGVAFELIPSPDGAWTETVLYNFGNGDDGMTPKSELVFGADGDLYGTTSFGGPRRGGTVFKLSRGQNGWTETILHAFRGSISGPDGYSPVGGIIRDNGGKLYGVTAFGGANGYGAVYELSPRSGGGYVERVIHSFNGYDGWEPTSGLAMDSSGKLYGTTSAGGTVGYGTIFQLGRNINGGWAVTVVHSLDGNDGSSAVGPVVFDRAGNLYGAAQFGGLQRTNGGSVYKLTPSGHGSWKETVLHLFDFSLPNGHDGQSPYAGVILNSGKLFGTTASGGAHDEGTVFGINLP